MSSARMVSQFERWARIPSATRRFAFLTANGQEALTERCLPNPPSSAGFPQYGFKAGISDEAFPILRFAIVLRAKHVSGFKAVFYSIGIMANSRQPIPGTGQR
jgi:hypothetical protein